LTDGLLSPRTDDPAAREHYEPVRTGAFAGAERVVPVVLLHDGRRIGFATLSDGYRGLEFYAHIEVLGLTSDDFTELLQRRFCSIRFGDSTAEWSLDAARQWIRTVVRSEVEHIALVATPAYSGTFVSHIRYGC
jgi:hypothetical protein